MAELSTIARPYTKAAFNKAHESKALDEWSAALALAAQAVTDEQLKRLLGNPAISTGQKAELVLDICSDASEPFQNFVKLLAENNRLLVLPEISSLFDHMKAELEKSVDVDLTSAFEMTKEQQTKLAQALGKKLDREINITTHVDATLIGGVVIKTEDLVIDGSVRGKLAKLSEALT